MTAADVVGILDLFEQHNIELTLDGGWAVDALLGRQTRRHADLDIAVQHKDVPQIRALLEAHGCHDIQRDDTRDCNFVLGDDYGHEIDIHSYTFDANGELIFGIAYPYDSMRGSGLINGRSVRCITPQWLVSFHTGYPPDENDFLDVKNLCNHFNLEIPSEFDKFVTSK